MLCPKCGSVLRESKKSSEYFLCDTCKKKIWEEDAIPEKELKKSHSHVGLIVVGLILAFLIASLILVLVFYNKEKSEHEERTTPETSEETEVRDISELDSLGDIDVEKEIFDVTIVVPADFVGASTQEELENDAAEYGYEVTLNDDGSATYVMSKRQHKKMMEDLSAGIEEYMESMIESEEYPNITDVKANSDYTEYTITTRNSEPDFSEAFSVMPLYMYSGLYHIFNGTEIDNIHVDFVNADTGEIISSSDSSEMNNAE